jgi:hypothetical protein
LGSSAGGRFGKCHSTDILNLVRRVINRVGEKRVELLPCLVRETVSAAVQASHLPVVRQPPDPAILRAVLRLMRLAIRFDRLSVDDQRWPSRGRWFRGGNAAVVLHSVPLFPFNKRSIAAALLAC